MAIGVVDDKDFFEEVSKIDTPIVKTGVVVDINRGRGERNLNVPDSLRKIIGEESEINGRQDAIALAKQFGISASSVSAYAHGNTSTSTYDKESVPIRDHIAKSKARITVKARNRLVLALDGITKEKLEAAKLRDVSAIAKDMSGIIRDMEPPAAGNNGDNKPQFMVYSPTFVKEEHFETIYVKE